MAKSGDMPPRARPGRYDWEAALVEMRQTPGEPVLLEAFTDIENVNSAYNSARQASALRVPGYTVVANIRSSYTDEATGLRRGDLWLTLVPLEGE